MKTSQSKSRSKRHPQKNTNDTDQQSLACPTPCQLYQSVEAVTQLATESSLTDLQSVADHSQQQAQAFQLKEIANTNTVSESTSAIPTNNTGLPDQLKMGIERLSGYSMNDVKVHYNSSKPAQLQAHAYAQGTNIHVAPGQEKHLPHEAWHVVQQKQGRVKPTLQMKGGVQINDDRGLEREADRMGAKATSIRSGNMFQLKISENTLARQTVQLSRKEVIQLNPHFSHITHRSYWHNGLGWHYRVLSGKTWRPCRIDEVPIDVIRLHQHRFQPQPHPPAPQTRLPQQAYAPTTSSPHVNHYPSAQPQAPVDYNQRGTRKAQEYINRISAALDTYAAVHTPTDIGNNLATVCASIPTIANNVELSGFLNVLKSNVVSNLTAAAGPATSGMAIGLTVPGLILNVYNIIRQVKEINELDHLRYDHGPIFQEVIRQCHNSRLTHIGQEGTGMVITVSGLVLGILGLVSLAFPPLGLSLAIVGGAVAAIGIGILVWNSVQNWLERRWNRASLMDTLTKTARRHGKASPTFQDLSQLILADLTIPITNAIWSRRDDDNVKRILKHLGFKEKEIKHLLNLRNEPSFYSQWPRIAAELNLFLINRILRERDLFDQFLGGLYRRYRTVRQFFGGQARPTEGLPVVAPGPPPVAPGPPSVPYSFFFT